MATVIVLNKDQMGSGDEELGRKILATCLRKLPASIHDLEAIIMFNGGVLLATKDSFVAQELTVLHDRGVELLVCGTCVESFDIRDRLLFDPPSNMDAILKAMAKADKVITI
jgi:intracellular sulfur oxidation DsrE/DsrF family protein